MVLLVIYFKSMKAAFLSSWIFSCERLIAFKSFTMILDAYIRQLRNYNIKRFINIIKNV
jgi:hypothetical protein